MAQVRVPDKLLERISKNLPLLAGLPAYPGSIDYDKEADVLSLCFARAQDAAARLMLEEGTSFGIVERSSWGSRSSRPRSGR
jgi:hypothetical protein